MDTGAMTGLPRHFTAEERTQIRAALLAHKEFNGLSAREIGLGISKATDTTLTEEAGRKRIERFLNDANETEDKFVGAIANYLNQVTPPDMEESAIAFAQLLILSYEVGTNLTALTGRYQTYIRPLQLAQPQSVWADVATVSTEAWSRPRREFETAYAIVTMTPMEKCNALKVTDAVTNVALNDDIDFFAKNPAAIANNGVLAPFGPSGFLMITRSLIETRMYRLVRVAENPVKLRGHLTLSGLQASFNRRADLQPFDPDYEVELIKVG
ncbi:hypothetical protein RA27_10120 [Ruegeria sp. ANG-R]|nr:hypothetical protein RA27_10120 [Ruegeria sp. ANG-R]